MRYDGREKLMALLLAALQLTTVFQAGSPAVQARAGLHRPDAGAGSRT